VGADVLKIDLASQSFMRDPFPALARMRQAGPVVRVRLPLLGKTWVATTHDAVSEVLKDDGTFVRDALYLRLIGWSLVVLPARVAVPPGAQVDNRLVDVLAGFVGAH